MSDAAAISPKLEDYLETIFNLLAEGRVARVSEIADRMGVQMPTVTGVLKHLARHGLVHYRPYQHVTLSPKGVEIARGMIRRHDVLKSFMLDVLGLPEPTAEQDACGMEHALSDETFERLNRFVRFVKTSPRSGRRLIDGFRQSRRGRATRKRPTR